MTLSDGCIIHVGVGVCVYWSIDVLIKSDPLWRIVSETWCIRPTPLQVPENIIIITIWFRVYWYAPETYNKKKKCSRCVRPVINIGPDTVIRIDICAWPVVATVLRAGDSFYWYCRAMQELHLHGICLARPQPERLAGSGHLRCSPRLPCD